MITKFGALHIIELDWGRELFEEALGSIPKKIRARFFRPQRGPKLRA
jgi:hypothetical protein